MIGFLSNFTFMVILKNCDGDNKRHMVLYIQITNNIKNYSNCRRFPLNASIIQFIAKYNKCPTLPAHPNHVQS